MKTSLLSKLVFCVLATAGLFGCSYLQSRSQDITFDQLPSDAREYMQENYGDNEIVAVEREKPRFTNHDIYAVNFMDKGQEWEAEFDLNGKLTYLGLEDD